MPTILRVKRRREADAIVNVDSAAGAAGAVAVAVAVAVAGAGVEASPTAALRGPSATLLVASAEDGDAADTGTKRRRLLRCSLLVGGVNGGAFSGAEKAPRARGFDVHEVVNRARERHEHYVTNHVRPMLKARTHARAGNGPKASPQEQQAARHHQQRAREANARRGLVRVLDLEEGTGALLAPSRQSKAAFDPEMDMAIWTAFNTGNFESVLNLVRFFHDPDSCRAQSDGVTALIAACRHGRADVARELLELGASPFVADKFDNSPLDHLHRWNLRPRAIQRIEAVLHEFMLQWNVNPRAGDDRVGAAAVAAGAGRLDARMAVGGVNADPSPETFDFYVVEGVLDAEDAGAGGAGVPILSVNAGEFRALAEDFESQTVAEADDDVDAVLDQFGNQLVLDDGASQAEEAFEDDQDSNDENYYANSYPDEDEALVDHDGDEDQGVNRFADPFGLGVQDDEYEVERAVDDLMHYREEAVEREEEEEEEAEDDEQGGGNLWEQEFRCN